LCNNSHKNRQWSLWKLWAACREKIIRLFNGAFMLVFRSISTQNLGEKWPPPSKTDGCFPVINSSSRVRISKKSINWRHVSTCNVTKETILKVEQYKTLAQYHSLPCPRGLQPKIGKHLWKFRKLTSQFITKRWLSPIHSVGVVVVRDALYAGIGNIPRYENVTVYYTVKYPVYLLAVLTINKYSSDEAQLT